MGRLLSFYLSFYLSFSLENSSPQSIRLQIHCVVKSSMTSYSHTGNLFIFRNESYWKFMINSRKMERYYVCVIGEVPEKISDKMMDFILVRAFFRMQHQVKVQALIPTLRFKKQHSFLLILFISGISPVGVPLIESTSASFLFQEILSIFLYKLKREKQLLYIYYSFISPNFTAILIR